MKNPRFFCVFAEDVDFDKDFDVVVLQEILEHVKDDRLILNKAYEHVKAGGMISISVPSKGLWAGSGHVRYYTEDTLVRAIRETLGEECFIDTREAGLWL